MGLKSVSLDFTICYTGSGCSISVIAEVLYNITVFCRLKSMKPGTFLRISPTLCFVNTHSGATRILYLSLLISTPTTLYKHTHHNSTFMFCRLKSMKLGIFRRIYPTLCSVNTRSGATRIQYQFPLISTPTTTVKGRM